MEHTREGAAELAERRKQMRRRKRRTRRIMALLLVAALVSVVGYVCLNTFFRLKSFVIEGNVRYDADEIIVYSGLELDSSLFSVDGAGVAQRLCTALPYIEEANISIRFPSSVAVTVKETTAVARIAFGGDEFLLSGAMKVLDRLPARSQGTEDPYAEARLLPLIVYPGVESCELAGSPEYDNDQIEEIVVDITERLVDNNILGDVGIIDVSDPYRLRLRYLDRFDVILGEFTELEYKFRYFQSIADERDKLDVGTIDVSDTQRGFYRP